MNEGLLTPNTPPPPLNMSKCWLSGELAYLLRLQVCMCVDSASYWAEGTSLLVK